VAYVTNFGWVNMRTKFKGYPFSLPGGPNRQNERVKCIIARNSVGERSPIVSDSLIMSSTKV
jgi:hypothetical protein